MKTVGRVALGLHLPKVAGQEVDVLQLVGDRMHVIHSDGTISFQPIKGAKVLSEIHAENVISKQAAANKKSRAKRKAFTAKPLTQQLPVEDKEPSVIDEPVDQDQPTVDQGEPEPTNEAVDDTPLGDPQ